MSQTNSESHMMKLYADKTKMHKNWHNINSEVQFTGDSPKMTRECSMHAATMTPIVAAIMDGVAIVIAPL